MRLEHQTELTAVQRLPHLHLEQLARSALVSQFLCEYMKGIAAGRFGLIESEVRVRHRGFNFGSSLQQGDSDAQSDDEPIPTESKGLRYKLYHAPRVVGQLAFCHRLRQEQRKLIAA